MNECRRLGSCDQLAAGVEFDADAFEAVSIVDRSSLEATIDDRARVRRFSCWLRLAVGLCSDRVGAGC
jgi:hypothetical protein